MEKLGIEYQVADHKIIADRVKALGVDSTLDMALAEDIQRLWADADVQSCYARRDEFWHLDATHYYLDNVLRFAEEDYSPNEEDMIMTRVRTTGIVVSEFQDPPITFNVVDVGGQRSERRKWIHCFDDVRGIIFLASLADYCQVLFEDANVNRMHESLNLFGEVTKNPAFEKTPLFVFLNKKDLFEQYIRQKSLKVCFPDYDGPDGEVNPAVEFIEKKYREVLQKSVPGKDVSIHIVAARVRMDMKIAFADVKDSLKNIYMKKKKGGR
jgi:GTPase SAR1 family protein